jgi:queuine tRNA-ribosyltransferase
MIHPMFEYSISATQSRARAGFFCTPHGNLETPIFAPVGTQATVKTLTPAQLDELGAALVLANTYHLYLRPGDELVAEMGGLHHFMQWPHPLLTDSGGFQVFSLAQTRKIDDEGVTFKSHIDGSTHRFTPEKSIQIQEHLGADIIMTFDECSDPNNLGYSKTAMDRTHRWAERSLAAKKRKDQALFGIIQGGVSQQLRAVSTQFIAELPFPGIAIGGLSVGETKEEMHAILDLVTSLLPENKPRYLMGVGTPEDTCQTFSRAYLRHLIAAKERLAGTLLSIHNLFALIQLVKDIRMSIMDNTFESKVPAWLRQWKGNAERRSNNDYHNSLYNAEAK